MKSKITTYVLIAIVVAVWGVVAFKLVEKQNPQPQRTTVTEVKKNKQQVDTLTLKYDDPFKIESPIPLLTNSETDAIVKIEPRETVIPKYIGRIRKSGVVNILFELDNHQYVLTQGESLNGFYLHKIYSDSIQLLKSGNTYTLQ